MKLKTASMVEFHFAKSLFGEQIHLFLTHLDFDKFEITITIITHFIFKLLNLASIIATIIRVNSAT